MRPTTTALAFLLIATTLADAAEVMFTKDVAPILFSHCVNCHRPGEVAPFSLLTYKDARRWSGQIVEVTGGRIMPPWKAEPGHGEFLGERRLTDGQIQTLRTWHEQGAPEGEASDLPPAPQFPDGWQLGEPDLVVKMPEAYELRADGPDDYRCFVIPLNVPEDKYVSAVEYRPGNRKIVHHALFFLDTSGAARRLDAADPGVGYARSGGPGFTPAGALDGWAPGVTPRRLPDGVARPLPKNSDLVIQTHFHPSGKVEREQSSVGIYFATREPETILASIPRGIRRLDIPAGEKAYTISDTFTVPIEFTLVGIVPHAHLLCKSIKVTATPPGEPEQSLIWIRQWDWDWQEQYRYKEPIRVPAGTEVFMEFTYDNSADNPKNPNNPPKRVRWGEQTADEMALVFFQVEVPKEAASFVLGGGRGRGGGLRQLVLQRFDKNKNGKLDPDEEQEAREAARRAFGGRRGRGRE